MARLPKLQWIPMILQAYNEARAKSGLKPVSPDELLNGIRKESTPSRSTTLEASTSGRKGKAAVPPAVRSPKGKRPSRMRQPAKPGAQFYSVVRELRKTRQKLNQVESLQAQLQQLQATVERQLSELNQKIDENSQPVDYSSAPSTTSENSASPSDSQNKSSTLPSTPAPSQFGGI